MKWLVKGLQILPLIVGAVHAVESLFSGGKKGKEKQDAAVDALGAMLSAIEGAAGKDILNDAAVNDAVRNLMSAYVSVQNVIRDAQAKRDAQP